MVNTMLGSGEITSLKIYIGGSICERRIDKQVSGGFKAIYSEKICDVVVPATYRAPSW
jgi:hypothetical protein